MKRSPASRKTQRPSLASFWRLEGAVSVAVGVGVYSRLAGYEDTNNTERLACDPAMRFVTRRCVNA